jgi:Ca2+-binding RTX toxin-like protein
MAGGAMMLAGGPGNDLVIGGFGRDRLSGGPGDDRIVDVHGASVVLPGSGTNDNWR